jgi:hypothetical protein
MPERALLATEETGIPPISKGVENRELYFKNDLRFIGYGFYIK